MIILYFNFYSTFVAQLVPDEQLQALSLISILFDILHQDFLTFPCFLALKDHSNILYITCLDVILAIYTEALLIYVGEWY